jgi:hypothetical protein
VASNDDSVDDRIHNFHKLDEFARDLAASDPFRSSPTGTDAAFEFYDRTLRLS